MNLEVLINNSELTVPSRLFHSPTLVAIGLSVGDKS